VYYIIGDAKMPWKKKWSLYAKKRHGYLLIYLRKCLQSIARWVFKTKIGNIGKVDRLKVKLVARGCE
jgi:hypothetical protein